MSDPIRQVLTLLSDHSLEAALTSFEPDGENLDTRISHFVQALFAREVPFIPSDLTALSKLHAAAVLNNEERSHLFELCLHLDKSPTTVSSQSSFSPPEQSSILHVIEQLPLANRTEEILNYLVLLFKKVHHPQTEEALAAAIVAQAPEKRASFIDKLELIISQLHDSISRRTFIEEMLKLSCEKQEALIESTSAYLLSKEESDLAPIIKTLCTVPDDKIQAFATAALPIQDPENRNELLSLLLSEPLEERNELIQLTLQSAEGLENVDFLGFLQEISSLDKEERGEILSWILPEIGLFTSSQCRLNLLEAINTLPKAQRTEEVVLRLGYLIQGISLSQQEQLLEYLSTITAFDWKNFFDKCSHHLIRIDNDQLFNAVFLVFAKLPKEEWSEENFLNLKILLETHATAIPLLISIFMFVIPPQQIAYAASVLNSVEVFPTTPGELYSLLCNSSEHFADALYDHIESELVTNPASDIVELLAQDVLDYRESLGISEESNLYGYALLGIDNTDPAALNAPKNPYHLFKQLKALANEPLDYSPSSEEVEGKTFVFDREAFCEKTKEAKQRVTFSHLPSGVDASTLHNLFRDLDQRIETLSVGKRESLLNEIQSRYAQSLQLLSSNFLYDAYLNHLMEIVGPADSPAPRELVQFFSILKYIQDQPNTLEAGAVLTKREETLLAMSASIQFCPAGKREGIELAYNLLPAPYKLLGSTAASEIEEGKEHIHGILQEEMVELLSSPTSLMHELTGIEGEIPQLSHQAIYAKNLLAPLIGLDWDVTFDVHTALLIDNLVRLPRDRMLTAFYRSFSPKTIAKALSTKISKELKGLSSDDPAQRAEAEALFAKLSAILGDEVTSAFEPLFPASAYHDGVLADDAIENGYALTTKGALKLLVKAGYLKEIASS